MKKKHKLLLIIKNIKEKRIHSYVKRSNNYLLFNEGRGNIYLENDGQHSDLFWMLNSDFPPSKILHNAFSHEDVLALERKGININNNFIHNHNLVIPKFKISNMAPKSKEKDQLSQKLDHYNYLFSFWTSMISTFNLKIYLTWYYHTADHIAIKDAFCSNGGIFAVWPQSYHGIINYANIVSADTIFYYSKSIVEIDRNLQNDCKYKIITGYPKDYAKNFLKSAAIRLRKRLQKNGAKIIISIFDENSVDDNRWHTGHELQRENYYFPLKLVLQKPWLGLIFKPKVAKTLRERLGSIGELLDEAQKTGRVFIYEESGAYTTKAPPILAALSSDICIHGHLGTAGLECALQNIPTLMIDREVNPTHQLSILPRDKIIFDNWENALNSLNEHLESPSGIPGFGNWSDYIDEFDPFRDGKAAYRIGTYLDWLRKGFDSGRDREIILADAADKYAKEWGSDKVIYHSN